MKPCHILIDFGMDIDKEKKSNNSKNKHTMKIKNFANEMLSQLYDKVAAQLTLCQGTKGFVNLTKYPDNAYYYVYEDDFFEIIKEYCIIGLRCIDGVIEIVGSVNKNIELDDSEFDAFNTDDQQGDETETWTPIKDDVSIIFGQTLLSIAEIIDEIGTDDNDDKYDLSDKLRIYDGVYDQDVLEQEGLCIICWPETQYLCEMDKFWEHAWLINDEYGLDKFGSSAYVVEEKWYEEN